MTRKLARLVVLLAIMAGPSAAQDDGDPFLESELIFPLDAQHNHSSSVVELPGGDLLVCWYRGSGERQADDVEILAARQTAVNRVWSAPFPLADTPHFPDANPILFVDSRSNLWLIWPVILANEWHTALLKVRQTLEYPLPGSPPRWEFADNLLLIPKNLETRVGEWLRPRLRDDLATERRKYFDALLERSKDKYFRRLGWMPRTHPLELPSGRILVPLYSDGFDFSLVAITDDFGRTWKSSEPLLGDGAVQPSLVLRSDGAIAAYFRDNGPAPKRILMSMSTDEGESWSIAKDTGLANPGSSVEVIRLRDGRWLMVANDTEKDRNSLLVSLSEDEGATWPYKRHLERDTREKNPASFHYPSVIQARDGSLHLTYSYFLNYLKDGSPRKSIKHARFNAAWVKAGDPASAR